MKQQRLRLKRVSKWLTVAWVVISVWGILNVYSTTYTTAITNSLIPKSVISSILGFIGCVIILILMRKNFFKVHRFICKNYKGLYLFSILMLVVVFIFGAVRGGARSVIHLFVDFQPLEMVKITAIIFLAIVFEKRVCKIGPFEVTNLTRGKDLLHLAAFMMIPIGLIILQPDLGGAIIVFLIVYVMFILHGSYARPIIKISIILMIAAIIALMFMSNIPSFMHGYQTARITNWLDPFADISDTGWGINNSLIGISNGNLLGVGFLKGAQKTFIKNPASTDYIFVTICEEWGIIGCLFTLGLILLICYCCFQIGNNAKRRWELLYCYGYAFLLLIQTVVNVCGVTNIIPMTGVTLPFISNGINSYLFLSVGLFICIVIARYNRAVLQKEEQEQEL